eukprot:TRINITY_DN8655_c0_g3_i2.p1 TRINITY_DN8655_c0_g3~~TRINITY_DN8655_c0_g3_i2.p1  ORF type:complete len:105 (-),score=39.24 TRINITY_DN8655_c0_g3_i2:283-573(-)
MESLLKRALVAEIEAAGERRRARESEAKAEGKSQDVVAMWGRVEEMQRTANSTGELLREMQNRLVEMEEEAQKQRQRASDNEAQIAKTLILSQCQS